MARQEPAPSRPTCRCGDDSALRLAIARRRAEPSRREQQLGYVLTMQLPESEPSGDIPEETINRNWTELVQELRSTQTGIQVLTGFLLTVPFSDRFDTLDDVQRTAYL